MTRLITKQSIVFVALVAFAVTLAIRFEDDNPIPVPVEFQNKTREAGLLKYAQTFAAVVTDLDQDGVDDLFVGNHGSPPSMYLNKKLNFVELPDAHPIKQRADRHCYTFVDLDNDGDKDFVFGGGGADGIGKGTANEVYKNLLVETSTLKFVNVSQDSDISYPTWRTRCLLPLPNKSGDKIDLYLTALHKKRPGSTNLYTINSSTDKAIRLDVDETSSLNLARGSDGRDIFFDFDRDGQVDLLQIGPQGVMLYKNQNGDFRQYLSALNTIWGVRSAATVDLNGDGFLDLYLGRGNGRTYSDNFSYNAQEIHFSISNKEDDGVDQLSFRTQSPRLKINFREHNPSLGATRNDPSDIFIGARGKNPGARLANIRRGQAKGKPEKMNIPGTYIWYDVKERLWHFLWKYDAERKATAVGIISGTGIERVNEKQLEKFPARETEDYIFINHGGKGWKRLPLEILSHSSWTQSITAADFNNDGFVDIAGIRTKEEGDYNGNPFILLNHGNLKFSLQDALQSEEDDIFRADLIVHGFFNDDGLPDLFVTNGYGLLPSREGPYQLWVNTSDNDNGYLLLELEGTTANRDAIGAQIELYAADGELLGYKELGPNYGRGQDTHKIHFGVGKTKGPFTVNIRWPDQDRGQEIVLQKTGFYPVRQ